MLTLYVKSSDSTLTRLAKSHNLLIPVILIYNHLPFVEIHNRVSHLLLKRQSNIIKWKDLVLWEREIPEIFKMKEINDCEKSVIFSWIVFCCLFVIYKKWCPSFVSVLNFISEYNTGCISPERVWIWDLRRILAQ